MSVDGMRTNTNKSIQKITKIPRQSLCCFRISLAQFGLCRHVQNYADTMPGEHVTDCVDFLVYT